MAGCKVLFIQKDIEGAEPIGALYVAACLRAAGHECRFTGTRGVDVLAEVKRYRPDVLAYGATTGLHRYYLGLNHHLKQHYPRAVSLLGGPHPTHFPEVLRTPGLDVICRGEGEAATVELCDAIASGRDHLRIRDLWVKHDGVIYKNPPRPLQADLDSIPFPARDLLYAYDDSLRRWPSKSFTANRGCPFPCSYCFNDSLVRHYGPSWRKPRVRSPENIVAEIAHVRTLGALQIVAFRESIFAHSAEWLRAFGELYRREVALPYYCHVRADLLTEEMIELLAWSGCYSVNVGIETASPRLAREVLCRPMKMERLRRGIEGLKRAGIVVFTDNILGIPSGTLEDDLRTLELNIELDVDYAAATICTPYPGTALASWAIEHGYFDGDFERIDECYYTESVFRHAQEGDKHRIENLQKLFALVAAFPALLPLARRLIDLPPNDFFYALFRSWYLVSHLSDVMPRRLDRDHLKESILSVFGVYHGADDAPPPAPPPEPLPIVDPPAAGPEEKEMCDVR